MTERPLATHPLIPRMVSIAARGYVDRRPIRPDVHRRFVAVLARARVTEPSLRPTARMKWTWNGVKEA